jgi:hypothetical protein
MRMSVEVIATAGWGNRTGMNSELGLEITADRSSSLSQR